jgi:hypothetical protein
LGKKWKIVDCYIKRNTATGLLCQLSKADCNGVDGGLEWEVKDTRPNVLRNRHVGRFNIGWDWNGRS